MSAPQRSSSTSGEGQESASNKKIRRVQTSSSAMANSEQGRIKLGERERSILSHELGLALTCSMYGRDPDKLAYLNRTERALPNRTAINSILGTAVREWPETKDCNDTVQKKEVSLTKKLSELIEAVHSQTGIHAASEVHVQTAQAEPNKTTAAPGFEDNNGASIKSRGRIDILLSEEPFGSSVETTPLAVIEVGIGEDWFKKLDQNLQYIDAISSVTQKDSRLQFTTGLTLCAVMTIDGTNEQSKVSFGVILCWGKAGGEIDRMALLWLNFKCTLDDASKAFGRFLQAASSLADWRKTRKTIKTEDPTSTYRYLSSHCCRVGETVSVVCPALSGVCSS
jgi:hypothetical protein